MASTTPDPSLRYVTELTAVGSDLYFSAFDPSSGQELWKINGTTFTQIADIHEAGLGSSPLYLTAVGSSLYFSAFNSQYGRELWRANGSTVELVDEFFPGARGSYPSILTAYDNTLYFIASDQEAWSNLLWRADATSVERVTDIRTGSISSSPSQLTVAGSLLYFTDYDEINGRELWRTDGTTVERISDIRAGVASPDIWNLTAADSTLYFTAEAVDTYLPRHELWSTDGQTLARVSVSDANYVFDSPRDFTAVGPTLYFTAVTDDADSLGYDLWRAKGFAAEEITIPGMDSFTYRPQHLTTVGSTLFFAAHDDSAGLELWRLDGDNVMRVSDLVHGVYSSEPRYLVAVGTSLYFTALEDSNAINRALWRTDGTTIELVAESKIFDPYGQGVKFDDFTAVGSSLYFSVEEYTGDTELWKIEGASVERLSLKANAEPALALSYALKQADTADALTQLQVLGNTVNPDARYTLDISAASLREGYNLESLDFTLRFNPLIFQDIDAADIEIGGALPIANAVQIDNRNGTIRFAAGSLSNLSAGLGVSAEAIIVSISLDFDETTLASIGQAPNGSFTIEPLSFQLLVNPDETILSKDFYESSFFNREIVSLAELGGGASISGQEVALNGSIEEEPLTLNQLGNGMVLGTQRVIGLDAGFTNLVRQNDVLEVTSQWLASRDLLDLDITVLNLNNQNARLIDVDAAIKAAPATDSQYRLLDVTASVGISGSAGAVVDLSNGLLALSVDGSTPFSNAGKGSKNLITYQGDLNYDGRVSMKDLAYLNAGAARQQLDAGTGLATAESYARDVDADFNGKIDLADLAVLDADWGKSLHTGDETFVGSDQVSWGELDLQGIAGETALSWDNSSFKAQNAVEAAANYVGSLESPAAVGVIGADGDGDSTDSDITGTYFQN